MQLRTLGGLALEGSSFRGPKPLLLLAYLALEGPTSKRELAELFFLNAQAPRSSLATTLGWLYHEGQLVILSRDRVEANVPCDAVRLLELLEAAVSAYHGPFLQGLRLELGGELEASVQGTREMLAANVREAHSRLAAKPG